MYKRTDHSLVRIGSEYRPAPAQGAETRWVSYRARDGLEIPAVLTLPQPDARGVGVVVIAQDGPSTASRSGYSGLVAMLAARGFAVLQPQYRGSYGFGTVLAIADRHPWRAGAADDVEDGLRWLRSTGIADANRACVIGRRYGGRPALQLADRAEGGVRCVAARTPLADRDVDSRYAGFGTRHSDAATPYSSASFALDQLASPAHRAEHFVVPVLGARPNFDDVLVKHADSLLQSLSRHGKPVDVIAEEGVDLYDAVAENRRRWFAALDAFLQRTMGASPVSPASVSASP